jgi:hypothetical protein
MLSMFLVVPMLGFWHGSVFSMILTQKLRPIIRVIFEM